MVSDRYQFQLSRKLKKTVLIGVIAIFICFLISTYFYARVISGIETEQIEQSVKELSIAQTKYIDTLISGVAANGETLHVMLEDFARAKELSLCQLALGREFFNYYFDRNLAREVAFLDKEGNFASVLGMADENWKDEDWSIVFDGASCIKTNLKTKGGRGLLVFAYPMRRNSLVEGAMLYAYDLDNFAYVVDMNSFSGQGFGHIIHKDGAFIFSSKNPNNKMKNVNFFDLPDGLEYTDGSTLEGNKKRIAEDEAFLIRYSVDGNPRVAFASPLGTEDWYLITVTQASVFTEQFNSKRINGYAFIFMLALAMLILVYFIIKLISSYSKDMRKANESLEEAKRLQEVENKKMRHAAAQIAGVTFEFFPSNRQMHILSADKSINIGKDIFRIPLEDINIHPDDRHLLKNFVELSSRDDEQLIEDIRIRFRGSDDFKWYRVSLYKVSDLPGDSLIGTLQDINLLKSMEAEQQMLLYAARRDALTGLYNRSACDEELPGRCATLAEGHYNVLFFLDIDAFKNTNDTYGHLVGDALLKSVGRVLLNSFNLDDFVCRWGGDEFLVLMSGIKDRGMAAEKARRMQRGFQSITISNMDKISVTCSIGYVVIDTPGLDSENLIKRADAALYKAKAAGKGQAIEG